MTAGVSRPGFGVPQSGVTVSPCPRPSLLEIDLDAVRHNLRTLRSLLSPGARLCAVVKADAYGHGLVPVAGAAIDAGADSLGIASVEEAVRVREAGITLPLLKLAPSLPDEIEPSLAAGVEEMVCGVEGARLVSRAARKLGIEARVHVNIDTGMGRQGIPADRAVNAVAAVARFSGVRIAGLMTHFPDADAEDPSCTVEQIRTFARIVGELRGRRIVPDTVHAANSAGLVRFPESHFSMARPGIALYGAQPSPGSESLCPLRPVMSYRTRVVQVRELPEGSTIGYGRSCRLERGARIATLPVGYSDGIFRSLGNRGEALIRGRRHRIAGRVSMNVINVRIEDGVPVEDGDEAVLLGVQGEERIRPEEMAEWAGTIPYEIFTSLGKPSSRKEILHTGGREMRGEGEVPVSIRTAGTEG